MKTVRNLRVKKLWRWIGLRVLNGNTGVALHILHYYIMRSKLVVLGE